MFLQRKNFIRPNKKRSLLRLTRPTVFWSADRTLFFDFASDTFWRRSVRGQLRCRSRPQERSRKVKIKQSALGRRSWLWPRLLSRDPGAWRDVPRSSRSMQRDFCRLQQIVHHIRFLRLPASTSKLTYRSFLFFWLIRSRPANQLFLVNGEANGSIICQVPRGQEAFFAEDVFCTWTSMLPCSRCCGLRLQITSLWIPRFAF